MWTQKRKVGKAKTTLKQTLQTSLLLLFIQAEDDEGFVMLVVKGEQIDEENKSEDLVKIMETFHTEVSL